MSTTATFRTTRPQPADPRMCGICGKPKPTTIARAAALTDTDLRYELGRLLRASVPGFIDIDTLIVDEQAVVFVCAPDGVTRLYRQNFVLSEGTVSLTGQAQAVREVTTFERVTPVPVTASAAPRGTRDLAARALAAPQGEVIPATVDQHQRILAAAKVTPPAPIVHRHAGFAEDQIVRPRVAVANEPIPPSRDQHAEIRSRVR